MSPMQSSTLSSPTPTHLGRYEILGVLGRGGMATVYLANSGGEGGFSRLVAVKVLHPHLAEQEDFVAMLLDEARLAARIHHPNVVPVVDLQSDGAQRYIVMDYVEGCALSDLLRRHRAVLPLGIVITVVRDALNGLHAAHTLTDESGAPLNLIHRDVTPQNILVGVDGMARLTDFGVALAQARIHHTRQRELKGKIAFMSPEQVRGLPLDHRADIFSLGCSLWLALTGQSLFLAANDAATLSNVINKEIPPPHKLNPKVPEVLSTICLRALDRDPNKRWSNAAEMAEALGHAALACDLVASRREVGGWIGRTCQREIDERRIAVRNASVTRTESRTDSRPRSVVHPQVTMPVQPSSIPTTQAPPATPSKREGFFQSSVGLSLMAIILMAILGAGLLILVQRNTSHPPDSSSPSASVPIRSTGQSSKSALPLPTQPPPPAVAPVVAPTVKEPPATTTKKTTPALSQPVLTVRKVPRARPIAPVRSAPPPATIVHPTDRPPTPSVSPPPRLPAAWDKDSPLPPQ